MPGSPPPPRDRVLPPPARPSGAPGPCPPRPCGDPSTPPQASSPPAHKGHLTQRARDLPAGLPAARSVGASVQGGVADPRQAPLDTGLAVALIAHGWSGAGRGAQCLRAMVPVVQAWRLRLGLSDAPPGLVRVEQGFQGGAARAAVLRGGGPVGWDAHPVAASGCHPLSPECPSAPTRPRSLAVGLSLRAGPGERGVEGSAGRGSLHPGGAGWVGRAGQGCLPGFLTPTPSSAGG